MAGVVADAVRHNARRRALLSGVCLLGVWAAVAPTPASTCAIAYRTRYIPLGSQKHELVVLELAETRTSIKVHGIGGIAAENLYWYGKARLLRTDRKGRLKEKWAQNVGSYRARGLYYYLDARRIVAKAQTLAGRLKGFKSLKTPKLYRCKGYRCGPATLGHKGSKLWLTVNGQKHQLLEKKQHSPLIKEHTASGNPITATQFANEAQATFLLRYRWGKRHIYTLMVLTEEDRMGRTLGWSHRRCRSIRTCIPPAAVGDHDLALGLMVVTPAPLRRSRRRP